MKGKETFRTIIFKKKGPFEDFESENVAYDIPYNMPLPQIGSKILCDSSISGIVKDYYIC